MTVTSYIGESAEREHPYWFRAWSMEHGERARIANNRKRRRTPLEDDDAERTDIDES